MFKEYFDADQSAAYGVIAHNDFIYATGTHTDLDMGYQGIYILKLDLQGNVLSYLEYFDLDDPLFFQNLIFDVQILDSFLYTGLSAVSGQDRIVKYNLETDTIESVYFIPKLSELAPPIIRSIGADTNDIFVLFNNNGNGPLTNTKIILQVGIDLDQTKVTIDRPNKREIAHKVYSGNGGNFFISNSIYEDELFKSQVNLIEIDSLGNIVWEYVVEEFSFFALDFICHASGQKVLIYLEFNNFNESRPVIEKINSDGEIIWRSYIGGNLWDDSFTSFWNRIQISNEGDGYIFAGTNKELVGIDSFQFLGVIGKLSLDGDSLWYKRFTLVEDEEIRAHSIFDLEKSIDGYVAVGRIVYKFVDQSRPPLQSYFIKIDNDGNINSDTTSANEIFENSLSLKIKIYPNPVSDYFYIEQTDISNINYQLLDSQGRLVKQFKAESPNQVLIVPVVGLVKGNYFLKAVSSSGEDSSWSIVIN